MRNSVRWTTKEQHDLARACISFFKGLPEYRDLSKLSKHDVLNYRGFWKEVFPSAQMQVLQEERKRHVVTWQAVPWLIDTIMDTLQNMVLESEDEPKVHLSDVEKLALALANCSPLINRISDAVVEKLAARYELQPKVLHEKARLAAVEQVSAIPKKLYLGIAGLDNQQQQDVIRAWGEKVDLKFISQQGLPSQHFDFLIVMTEKVTEHTKANWRKVFAHRYKPAHGATSTVKKLINDLYAAHINGH